MVEQSKGPTPSRPSGQHLGGFLPAPCGLGDAARCPRRKEYGSGSSRDWAAKGTRLLGVRAVLAESFERIHRSNLVGMGVLPLQFKAGESADSLGLTGEETYSVSGLGPLNDGVVPEEVAVRADGTQFTARPRIDTPLEAAYYRHDGIMPYVLRQLLAAGTNPERG